MKGIFEKTREAWERDKLTGRDLWSFCTQETQKRAWILNPSYVRGHRISSFPHKLLTKAKMPELDWSPQANVWVLEVQICHPERNFGAFYEDILR